MVQNTQIVPVARNKMLKLDIAFSLTVSLLSLFNSFSFFSFVGVKGFFFLAIGAGKRL